MFQISMKFIALNYVWRNMNNPAILNDNDYVSKENIKIYNIVNLKTFLKKYECRKYGVMLYLSRMVWLRISVYENFNICLYNV